MKRKLNDEQVRTLVASRRTKGAAFNPPPEGYIALLKRVERELALMSIAEIKRRWPELTYDIK